MAQFIAWQSAEAKRRTGESVIGEVQLTRCEFFGPSTFFYSMSKAERFRLHEELLQRDEAPHAFLIEFPAGSESPAHFHRVPQYQVFVQGGGQLGRNHAVAPVTFHYTDEFTGYGPIVAAKAGLSYFTLRNYFDPGAEPVNQPGVREKLRPSARRYLVVGPDALKPSSDAALAAQRDASSSTVIEAHDDGVAACVLRAGAGVTVAGPEPAAGGGQYWLVLRGSAVHENVEYIRNSLAWVSRTEKALTMTAGTSGAEIAVLQFPRALTSRGAAPPSPVV
jgi:hypothetical protein